LDKEVDIWRRRAEEFEAKVLSDWEERQRQLAAPKQVPLWCAGKGSHGKRDGTVPKVAPEVLSKALQIAVREYVQRKMQMIEDLDSAEQRAGQQGDHQLEDEMLEDEEMEGEAAEDEAAEDEVEVDEEMGGGGLEYEALNMDSDEDYVREVTPDDEESSDEEQYVQHGDWFVL
jgi:hypothetical protein